MMKKLLLTFSLFAGSLAVMAQEDLSAKYADLITQKALKEKLTILAGPEMEGRETGYSGQKKAAAWIEEQFKKFGLQPGNAGSYQQLYPVYFEEINTQLLRVNGKTFNWDKEYNFTRTGMHKGNKTFNSIVYVGMGDSTAGDYAGLDIRGKVVMILDTASRAPGFRAPNPMAAKLMTARNNGAAGIIVVSKLFPKATATPLKSGMVLNMSSDPALFSASVNNEVASALLGRTSTISFADLAAVKKGTYISELQIGTNKAAAETLEASNVIGVLPGTDKADEFVFVTGHYDHLGKRGDVIYYGADDDGSGTVGVMQMAEAFARAAKKGDKPRRTMIFMTVSGEEKGLLGSEYYSEHPTVNMAKASVDLNIDMIGRVDTERKTGDTLNYVYVIGHDKLSSDLPIINEGANNKYTKLTLDYKYDDPKDQNRIYFRSDHYNFAKKGVPILFFYDGMLQADYHKPTDTVDKIYFELMEKRTKMIFHTAWEMANRNDMLKRDTPLNMGTR